MLDIISIVLDIIFIMLDIIKKKFDRIFIILVNTINYDV